VSNLNRQFLFQKHHVGKSKAFTARESVLKYACATTNGTQITSHHDSVMTAKYSVEYFRQFALVLNALDNKAARSHVNRLCLAADVPLVESGTAGYLGQITLISKGRFECYDCLAKAPAKSFPGCTIRNTPSEPIHCIVWAKHLFNQLFGVEDPDEAVSPDGEDPENMAQAGEKAVENLNREEQVCFIIIYKLIILFIFTPTL
jgi:ubiquitin-like 1-activating enzyme E1 B